VSSVTDRLVAGRYRLGRVLGRGGMADVHEAQDERLGRSVAVKMLRREVIAAHPEVRARFEAEARSAASLTHPNVVAVYDTGEHEGLPFIVMERLPGETLAERMGRGPLDLAWLRRVAGDVLGALGAAHAAGIVHRDIKPGNILIDESGCAKVADFGIAKSLEGTGPDLTSTNLLIGTPAYMAPERVAGDPATAQADIYGVGVVLYEAAAGRKPFTGATPIALAYAIRQGGSEPLPAVRPDVDPIFASTVATAMAVEPRDRFPSAAAMASALVGSSADDPTLPAAAVGPDATMTMPASATAVPAGAAPWWRRRDVRIGALALVGLVLLLGAMAWASGGAGNKARAESPTTVATAPPPTAAPVVVTTVAPTTTTTTFSQAVQDQIQQQMDKMRAQLERQRARGGGGGNGGGD
jgi:serine/threonine-protein kinase